MVSDIDRARDALYILDPGAGREIWVRIGMAAKAAGIDLDTFDSWSSAAGNYSGRQDTARTWNSFKPGPVTEATLFRMAKDSGWVEQKANGHNVLAHRPARERFQRPQETRKNAPERGQPPFDFKALWQASVTAPLDHPYIVKKLGIPNGLRVYRGAESIAGEAIDGALLVPAADGDGTLQTFQAILTSGRKLNAPGLPVRGWFTISGNGPLVYVCEGIGQAWSAHQATGAPAVCSFGFGRLREVASALQATAMVALVADVGKEVEVERMAVELSCAWIAPPGDLGKNGDLNDLHRRDGLQAVADLLSAKKVAEGPEPRFRLLTADQLSALPAVAWSVRNVLPSEGLAAIFGPSGSGKTFLVLSALLAVSMGADTWFGHRVRSCPVTYFALEGEAGIAQRVDAYRQHFDCAPSMIRFVVQPFALLNESDVSEMAREIRNAGFAGGIVAIDTLNRAVPGADENDSRDMGEIIAAAKALQAEVGGLVLLVHHSGKDAAKGLRGHSSLLAALDAVIEVSRDSERRQWRVAKSKDSSDSAAHPFRLQSVALGTDEDNEPLTSCVVEPEVGGDSIRQSKVPGGGNMRVAWDCIGELLRAAGEVRPDDAPRNLPQGRPVVQLEDAIGAVAVRLVCESKRRRERATQAIQGLCGRALVRHEGGFLWCS